jgi:zinc protease
LWAGDGQQLRSQQINRFRPALMRAMYPVVAALAVLALSCGGAVASHKHRAIAQAPQNGPSLSDAWPELRSDLPSDPDTHLGVLGNGMRYAIRRNTTPPGVLSIRLRIGAGSLDEAPEDAGVAHLIEHMTFRGTTHMPDGEAIKSLEGLGLSMEADVNAFTSPTQTFFTYDLPKNDTQSLTRALQLLRETASEALFDPKALESEKQVVLAERRVRDSAAQHTQIANEMLVLGDAFGRAMLPIGNKDVIEGATSGQLRAFYQAHYRPESATLIVAGDIDPNTVEAAIKLQFSNWHGQGAAMTRPSIVPPGADAAHVALLTEPDAPNAVLYNWVKPADGPTDGKARRRSELVELIGLTIFNRRLEELSKLRGTAVAAAAASHISTRGLPDLHQHTVFYGAKGVIEAMQEASAALDDLLTNGVTQEELDRTRAQLHSLFDAADAGGATTSTPTIANLMLKAVDDGSGFLAPKVFANLMLDESNDITTNDVKAAMRNDFSGTAPFVLVSGREAPRGGVDAVSAALNDRSTKLTASATSPAKTSDSDKPAATSWPYGNFGTKGTVVARQDIADLAITMATFANGVHATIKPTSFRGGQILVSVSFGHGRLGLPKSAAAPAWALKAAYPLGGLKLMPYEDLKRHFETQFVNFSFSVNDDTFELVGSTEPKDLDSELQVLTAYLSDPGWRGDAFEQARVIEMAEIGRAQTSPDDVLARNDVALLHDGDNRWAVPDAGGVNDAGPRETRSILADALKGPLDVTVVGDVGVDRMLDALASTFGALPARLTDEAQIAGDEKFADIRATPLVLHHNGGADQAAAEIDWRTVGYFPDPQQTRSLRVLQEVLLHRLYDELRTREGIAYSPQVRVDASLDSPDFGYLSAAADVPPDKITEFYETVSRVVDALKTKAISDEELARARDPHVDDVVKERNTNEYWIAMLSGASADPRLLDLARTTIAGLKSVTAADVLRSAQTYLRDDRAFKVVVVPQGYSVN